MKTNRSCHAKSKQVQRARSVAAPSVEEQLDKSLRALILADEWDDSRWEEDDDFTGMDFSTVDD